MSRKYINDDWLFTDKFNEEFLESEQDETFQNIRIPHTCRELPLHYFDESMYQMISGYKRYIEWDKSYEGKRIFVVFEGMAHQSTIFVNGNVAGEHNCGYTAKKIEITDYLQRDRNNVLAVRLNSREDINIPPFGNVIDYMTYGGIYRDVYLEIKNSDYIKDVYVRTGHNKNGWYVNSQIELNNISGRCTVRQYIAKKDKNEYKYLSDITPDKEVLNIKKYIDDAEEWSPENPKLYVLRTEMVVDGEVTDTSDVIFGFRVARFKKNGFYLNGKRYKIRGLNRHQSYPYVGYAMPESMQKMDADILKYELGLNAVRTSHYPQSHYFLDRCDEIGLLVFTEIPGWQHIGNEEWKNQAVENVRDMVLQYRNHTSIILWGVRINESADDDDFYERTNAMARKYDIRPTGGVRCITKSHLLEDVYTYNDFLHNGSNNGCLPKNKVTSDMEKAYLISEYNGHMYPTKNYDCEEHRVSQALRHAKVLDSVSAEKDIAGSFGWCMADYNTHKDFGSGDRICYHGVLDMFRNEKMAAYVYASQQDEVPVLEISSSMDIGEHPESNRGNTYIFTNADSVRMYKNDIFIKEYKTSDSPYGNLKHGPVLIDDFIGNRIYREEKFTKSQADDIRYILNMAAAYGLSHLPKIAYIKGLRLMAVCHINQEDAVRLYNKYIGDWGSVSKSYRFDAVKDGKIIKTVIKEPPRGVHLEINTSSEQLTERNSYDVAAVRIRASDENGNVLSFCNDPVVLEADGDIEIIGPAVISFNGGLAGTYVKSKKKTDREKGCGVLKISFAGETKEINFSVNWR